MVKSWRPLKLGKKLPVFQIHVNYFLFWQNLFFKDSFTKTFKLLDFIGFWLTFGVFHYSKLPSYKWVRWSRLAGPSLIYIFPVVHAFDIPVLTEKNAQNVNNIFFCPKEKRVYMVKYISILFWYKMLDVASIQVND